MKYPIPSVRAVVGKREIVDRLKGGETWVEAIRRCVKEQAGLVVKTETFLGMGAPFEREGEWWLPADFAVQY